MKWIILIWVILFNVNFLCSQEITISGGITDNETGEALEHVLVTVKKTNDYKIVQYSQTSENGSYRIRVSLSSQHKYVLHFSIIGYTSKTISISNNQYVYNLSLIKGDTKLKEITIKPPNIQQSGDTIRYLVSSFSDTQDRSIGDVLKKMPGIEIDKGGTIKYNGIAINKFYIEGKDMLGGRYGLATNNLHQVDVSSVEILENHQPIKALEKVSFSHTPAVNIRLKKNTKSRWIGTVNTGAGFTPFIWSSELTSMQFSPNHQSLNIYKTNNIGLDITKETKQLSYENIHNLFIKNYTLKNYITVKPNLLTNVEPNLVRFNKSHLASSNNLWSLNKGVDLTSQISYTNEQLNSDNIITTNYYLKDSTIIANMEESTLSKKNNITTDIQLNVNTSNYYIKNRLNLDFIWDNLSMEGLGSYANHQKVSTPHYKISNDLELLKRTQNKTYKFNSFNLYQIRPQSLTVSKKDITSKQNIESSAFYTNTETSIGSRFKSINISAKLGVIGLFRAIDSELVGYSDTLGLMNNDSRLTSLNMYISPEIEYKNNQLEAKFDIPVSFIPYFFNDKLAKTRKYSSKLFSSPQLYIRYQFNPRFYIHLLSKISLNPVEEQSFYNGLILQDYRNLSSGLISYKTGNQKLLRLNFFYKRPLDSFFLNGSLSTLQNKSRYTSERLFFNELILNRTIPKDNSSVSWALNSTVSKGIDIINGMISIRSEYISYEGSIFQNQTRTPYSSSTWTITSNLNSSVTSWFNILYEFSIVSNHLKIEKKKKSSFTNYLSQKIICNFTPIKKYQIRFIGESYYNKMNTNRSKHLLLANIDFTYKLDNIWEFDLSVKNIFNQDTYNYTLYDGLVSTNKKYKIRPVNFLASVFFRF